MVSVIVATYNPDWEKLKLTLLSILLQNNVNFEIVVSDDGSTNFHEDKISALFKEYKFKDYIIRRSECNKGILDNCYNGCKLANGRYIKLISPGDFLYSDKILGQWETFMDKHSTSISFGNAVHYKRCEKELEILKERNLPRVLKVYDVADCDIKAQQMNYLVLDDVANGASFMCDRELLLTYFSRLLEKIVYAEDSAYKLMVLDGIALVHYPDNVIWYESGTGVSWSKEFSKKMDADIKSLKKMITEKVYPPGSFASKYQQFLGSVNASKRGKTVKRLIRLKYFPKVIYWEEYRKINPVYTTTNVDDYFAKYLLGRICDNGNG